MKNKPQVSDNDQLWREISIAYKNFIKPTRKSIGLQFKKPMYPYLEKGRHMEDL